MSRRAGGDRHSRPLQNPPPFRRHPQVLARRPGNAAQLGNGHGRACDAKRGPPPQTALIIGGRRVKRPANVDQFWSIRRLLLLLLVYSARPFIFQLRIWPDRRLHVSHMLYGNYPPTSIAHEPSVKSCRQTARIRHRPSSRIGSLAASATHTHSYRR